MANTTFNARLKQKFDTWANWNGEDGQKVVLLKGELAIVQVPASNTAVNGDTARPQYLVKVGDGETTFSELPWLSAKAADVYDWAKTATKPTYTASEIQNLEAFISGQIEDTNTTYQIAKVSDTEYKLQSKEKGGGDWTDVDCEHIVIKEFDDSAIQEHLTTLDESVETAQTAAETAETNAQKGITDAAAAKKAADTAQTTANAAMPKAGGTFTGAVTLSGAPTTDLHAATKKYVDDAKAEAVSTAASDATSKADQALEDAKADSKTKADQALIDAKKYTDEKTAGMTGAMHFAGTVTEIPPESGGPYNSGDVVIFGTKEYVYDGEDWHEMGDEGSHVLKTQKINGHALSGDVNLTATDVGAATKADITTEIGKLDATAVGGAGKYISQISQTDGKITATATSMPTALKNPNALTVGEKTYDGSKAVEITAEDLGAVTDISGKQDVLAFDGTYNAASNKVATVSTVTGKIDALNKADAAVAKQVVSAVSESKGIITVTRRALVADDIPTLAATKITGLATVATSGKIDDLTQTSYIILDGGSSSTVI